MEVGVVVRAGDGHPVSGGAEVTGPVLPYAPMVRCSSQNDAYAMIAAIGIVSTQAHTMFLAMPHRTAFMR